MVGKCKICVITRILHFQDVLETQISGNNRFLYFHIIIFPDFQKNRISTILEILGLQNSRILIFCNSENSKYT